MIYICIAFVLALFSIFEVRNGGNSYKLDIFVTALLIVMAGFRAGVGLDYVSYKDIYELIHNDVQGVTDFYIEPAWYILNRILPDFRIVLLAVASMAVLIRRSAFQYAAGNRYMVTACFFYYTTFFLYYDMGIMRQGISIAFCCFSLRYITKKNPKFFLCILIAFLFHTTALVFIPLYFVGNKEYPRILYYGVLGIGVFLLLINYSFYGMIQSLVHAFGGNLIINRFDYYSITGAAGSILGMIRRVLFLVFFIEIYKRRRITFGARQMSLPKRGASEHTWLYINAYCLSILVMLFFELIGFGTLAGRASASLYSIYIFLYIEIISEKKLKTLNMAYYIAFMLLAFITLGNTVYHSSGYLPYRFGILG